MDTNDAAGTAGTGGQSDADREAGRRREFDLAQERAAEQVARDNEATRAAAATAAPVFDVSAVGDLPAKPARAFPLVRPTDPILSDSSSVGNGHLEGRLLVGDSVLLPEPALRLPAPTGVAALPFDREASPSGSNFDVETDRAAASRGRVQAVGARFANVRAHLVHAANGDVRAITAGLTAVVDLIEAEFNAASGGNAPVEAAAAVTGGLTDTEQAARAVLNDLLTENDRLTASLRWIAEQSAAGTAAVELGEKASNTLDAVPSRWSRGPTPHHTGAG